MTQRGRVTYAGRYVHLIWIEARGRRIERARRSGTGISPRACPERSLVPIICADEGGPVDYTPAQYASYDCRAGLAHLLTPSLRQNVEITMAVLCKDSRVPAEMWSNGAI
jgi:hypothetical protein